MVTGFRSLTVEGFAEGELFQLQSANANLISSGNALKNRKGLCVGCRLRGADHRMGTKDRGGVTNDGHAPFDHLLKCQIADGRGKRALRRHDEIAGNVGWCRSGVTRRMTVVGALRRA